MSYQEEIRAAALVLFSRHQSNKSLGHSGREKKFKWGEKAIFFNKNYFAYGQVVVLSTC